MSASDAKSWQVAHDDIAAILVALHLGDHARPISTHEVVQREILPAIKLMEKANEILAGDLRQDTLDASREQTRVFAERSHALHKLLEQAIDRVGAYNLDVSRRLTTEMEQVLNAE